MDDALRERVEALERAVTDGDHDLSAFADEAAALERLDTVQSRAEDIEDRVEELEAATQALRGYVGNIRSVNTDVEQRADAALARVESIESALGDGEATPRAPVDGGPDGGGTAPAGTVGETLDGDTDRPDDCREVTTQQESTPETGVTFPGESTREAEVTSPGESTPGTDGAPSDRSSDRTDLGPAATGPGTGGGDTGAGGIDLRIDRTDDSPSAHHGRSERTEQSGVPVSQEQSADTRPGGTAEDGGSRGAIEERCRACGRPHDTGPEPSGGNGADPSIEGHGTDPGGGFASDEDHASDGDVVPDGDGDPLVGATEGGETGESGTLQRIRELL